MQAHQLKAHGATSDIKADQGLGHRNQKTGMSVPNDGFVLESLMERL